MTDEDTEKQLARAFLRVRFLRFIANLTGGAGQKAELITNENTKLSGNLKAFSLDFNYIIVENIQTPFLPVEIASLRASDILSVHMKNVPSESFLCDS